MRLTNSGYGGSEEQKDERIGIGPDDRNEVDA
jgi:hypothetical protein